VGFFFRLWSAVLNEIIGISIHTRFSLGCISKTCSACLLSPLALNAPKSGSKLPSETLVRFGLRHWDRSDSGDRWRNDRDRCLCSNHFEFNDVALHDCEYGNYLFRSSVGPSNDSTCSCAHSATARDSSSETTTAGRFGSPETSRELCPGPETFFESPDGRSLETGCQCWTARHPSWGSRKEAEGIAAREPGRPCERCDWWDWGQRDGIQSS